MTLRTRLAIVICLILATYVITARIILTTQRQLLTEQVDQRLESLPPSAISVRGSTQAGQTGGAPDGGQITEITNPPESPFSELYIGLVGADGSVTDLLIGSLLKSRPDIASVLPVLSDVPRVITIKGDNSEVRFRAAIVPQPIANTFVVAAQPLTETDAAIARLRQTLVIAGVAIAGVLGVAFFWVQRYGLRPIATVTTAAEAISGGDRAHRVEVENPHTEAGKLGTAFNLMLDERDADEARIRQFVADASHELRTPLTSVRGYLELYRQGAFQEESQLRDVVRRMSAETARMHTLVEDLLALASLDEGRPLRHETTNLALVLRDAVQDAMATQPDRRFELDLPETGLLVEGDPSLLVQLAGILVGNAVAHTPATAGITISGHSEQSGVVFSVKDDGPGLADEVASRVFDRFWRGESGRGRQTGSRGGAGLGLAIARSIVDAHHGTIELITAPGAGCTFTVKLPRTIA